MLETHSSKGSNIGRSSSKNLHKDEFDHYFLTVHCRKELILIYKHCWPNELAGPKPLAAAATHKKQRILQDTWTNFGRESNANMLKFARFFGLASILKVS